MEQKQNNHTDRKKDETNPSDGKSPEKTLTARQKKELRKKRELEQKELEKKLIAEGKIPVRTKYRPRSFLWNIVAVCMAFLFGIVFTLGALVGGGYFVSSKYSVKDIFNALSMDYTQYVTDEYAEKTVLELFQDVRSNSFDNLDSIGKYTPLLKNQLDSINEQLAGLGVIIDVDELMSVNFSDLPAYFQDEVIGEIQLGGIIGVTPDSSPLMISICYGKEGTDYTVSDGEFVQIEGGKTPTTIRDLTEDATGIINEIEIASALDVNASSNSTLRYIAFGSYGIDYEIVDGEIVMLGDSKPKTFADLTADDSDFINNARIGDLIDTSDATSEFLLAVRDWTVGDLKQQSRIERLKIGQIFPVDETSSLLMQTMKDWRIKDLTDQDMIDSLTIGDVLAVDENSAQTLRSLADTPLGDFNEKLNTLRLSDILDTESVEGNKILRNLGNSTLTTLSSDLEALTVQQMFGDEIYEYTLNYVEDDRSEPYEGAVTTKHFVGDTEVVQGYFVRNDTGAYTRIDEADVLYDAEIAMANREESAVWATPYYKETRIPVEESYSYSVVDYDNDGQLVPLGKEVIKDDTGEYYLNESGEKVFILEDIMGYYTRTAEGRTDLERVYAYTLDGAPVDAKDVKRDEETGAPYTEVREEVFLKYYSPLGQTFNESDLYEETQVTETYTAEDGSPLTRYLTGIWHMLLTDSQTGEELQLSVLDMNALMDNMTENINHATLLELYVYAIISSPADVDISSLQYDPNGGSDYVNNLNELTVSETVRFVDYIVAILKQAQA